MPLTPGEIEYGRAVVAAGLVSVEQMQALSQASELSGVDLRTHLMSVGALTPAQDGQLRGHVQGWNSTASSSAASKIQLPGAKLPRVGERFGAFHIEREIARGGLGAVYAARDGTGRQVALKVLLQQGRGKDLQRFQREASVGMTLAHPGICPVLACGEVDGVAYLTMPLLVGARSLTEYAEQEQLSTRERIDLVIQTLDAIGAAHAADAIHRDLKPGNVLVEQTGAIKVVDFGLAKQLDQSRLTETGQVMGTPHYMAPEQVRGEAAHADARCDLFSLGVILYELVTHRRPFEAETSVGVMKAILEEEPRLEHVDEGDLRGLRGVLAVAMAKLPGDRYPDAAAFADDLRALCRGEGVSARARAYGRQRRRRRLALGLVLAALAGGVPLALTARSGETEPLLDPQALREGVAELDRETRRWIGAGRSLQLKPPDLAGWRAELARLERAAGRAPDPPAELATVKERLGMLDGLNHLLGGDLPAAQKQLQALLAAAGESTSGPYASALRGAVAAVVTGGDAAASVKDLSRALSAGVALPELKGWRARAQVRAGLSSSAQATEVLAALRTLGKLRPLSRSEQLAAGEALLVLGKGPRAAQVLGDVARLSPRLADQLTIVLAEYGIGHQDPAAALAALRKHPFPPGSLRERRESLRKAALKRVDRMVRPLQRKELKPAERARALALLRVAHLALPGDPLPRSLLDRLLDIAISHTSDPDLELGLVLGEVAPDDPKVQRAVGLLTVHPGIAARKKVQLIPVLKRAIGLAQGAQREELVVALVQAYMEANQPKRCLEESTRLLSEVKTDLSRADVFFTRYRAAHRLKDERRALRNITLAIEASPDQTRFRGYRSRAYRKLGQDPEAYADALIFARSGIANGTLTHHHCVQLLWEIGVPLGKQAEVLGEILRLLRYRKKIPGWRVRAAHLQLQKGNTKLAAENLRLAAAEFRAHKKPAYRRWAKPTAAAAEAVEKRGQAAQPKLGRLITRLEKARGKRSGP